uniref:Uncharacterized iron-regulated protein n=1 Tax=Candidatus Kentrum sp. DK TaxID=2126562 RepID=A0A450TKJ7_9GAMM|nr:MAG: Uncharacterized iron-regulated protein [Candidatus Kentron sp. DK]
MMHRQEKYSRLRVLRAGRFRIMACVLPWLLLLAGCQTAPPGPVSGALGDAVSGWGEMETMESMETNMPATVPARVIDFGALPELDRVIPRLAGKRLIFVGERHTRLSDHDNQLAVIRGLYGEGRALAIGMEFFQRPFQAHLDDFVAGRIDEQALLSRTEYYRRWRYDWRLYRPILRFARERKIPLVALNAASEMVEKVSRAGWEGLTEAERARVPASIDRSNEEYERRLRGIFRDHPQPRSARDPGRHPGAHPASAIKHRAPDEAGTDGAPPPNPHDSARHADRGAGSFQRFMDVQLLWDETMAERAAAYLAEHPDRTLVVLAGSGHLAYGHGIPDRVRRRLPVADSIILPAHVIGEEGEFAEDAPDAPALRVADFLLLSPERELPPPGRLGVVLEMGGAGLEIASFAPESPAEAAGMAAGDGIRRIDGRAIETMADIKLALWDKRPGDRVSVEAVRLHPAAGAETVAFEVRLQ